jgi:hypothetical protein
MTAAKSDGKNRTRPSSAIYRIIMVEFERQRLARGLSMSQVDDLAGTQDGFYGKMLYPDSPSGRQSRWETIQDVADALFGRGFEIRIIASEAPIPSAAGIDKGASSNALKNRHWRHTRHFKELGSKGGKARFANKTRAEISAMQSKINRKRWRNYRRAIKAQRAGEAHKAANASKARRPVEATGT